MLEAVLEVGEGVEVEADEPLAVAVAYRLREEVAQEGGPVVLRAGLGREKAADGRRGSQVGESDGKGGMRCSSWCC